MGIDEINEFHNLCKKCSDAVKMKVIQWLSVKVKGKLKTDNIKDIIACVVGNILFPDIVSTEYLHDLKIKKEEIIKKGKIFNNKYIILNLGNIAFYNDVVTVSFSNLEEETLELVRKDLLDDIRISGNKKIKKKQEYLDSLFE